MAICLSHASADVLLEDCAYEERLLEPASSGVMSSCGMSRDEVADVITRLTGGVATPVDLLVADDSKRRKSNLAVGHKWTGTLPDGSILSLDEGVYLSSPKLCLLQQAGELHLVNLCQMLGRYLGSFSREKEAQGKKVKQKRGPLVDAEDLAMYVRAARGARNVVSLREAIRLTCAGAASPQEVNLQLVLTLPRRFGGFELPRPIMNYEIPLDGMAQELCGKRCCLIDLYWPDKKLGIEYQGADHGDQLGEDYARHFALHSKGIELWYVANEQMTSAVQMNYLASVVAARLERDVGSSKTWPTIDRIQRLLDVLAGKRLPSKGERW